MNGYDDPGAWYGKKSPQKDVFAALDNGLRQAHRDLIDHFRDEHSRYETAQQVQKSLFSLGLLDRLQDLLEQFRRENARMLISDTGLLLRQVIGRDNEIPFIYEKVGTRFQHSLARRVSRHLKPSVAEPQAPAV